MHDANTDFQDSATFQMHASDAGFIHNNQVLWKCSGYDMDVSSNIVFENNNFTSTNAGILPHGNSVSFYDYQNFPTSANWSFSHNYLARPRTTILTTGHFMRLSPGMALADSVLDRWNT